MFPTAFAFDVVTTYCPDGGTVLDPFAGRGTSVFAAAATGRTGCGIEIDPIGWLYGSVKLKPAQSDRVLERLDELSRDGHTISGANALPEFFHRCFSPPVLRFLLQARGLLRWRDDDIDRTLMAFILVNLHGKREQSLSNQMRQGKAMSPAYSIRWWETNDSEPPALDPVAFLRAKIAWRYAKGIIGDNVGRMVLADSTHYLQSLSKDMQEGRAQRFDLVFTSPPYFAVTNYFADQWIRRWMLGGPPAPVHSDGPHQGRFASRELYEALLSNVFQGCARICSPTATVFVRTDARPYSLETTLKALTAAFPNRRLAQKPAPFSRPTQTALYGDASSKPGEMDLILTA